MKSIIISILLFGIAICLTTYSHEYSSLIILIVLFTFTIAGTIFASVWIDGNYRMRLLSAGKIVFPLTASLFLLGYFYVILKAAL